MGPKLTRRPARLILAAGITALLGVTALAGLGASAGSASTTASAAGAATVKLVHTSKGKILANSRGFTLYMFTADKRNSDRCVKKSGCTSVWPLLTVKGKPSAGSGVKRSLLGTIRVGSRHQVTYASHPLYTYSGDFSPASTGYVGVSEFGGRWYALNAAGKPVK